MEDLHQKIWQESRIYTDDMMPYQNCWNPQQNCVVESNRQIAYKERDIDG